MSMRASIRPEQPHDPNDVVKQAEAEVRGVLANTDRIVNTPTQEWSISTRQESARQLSQAADRAAASLEGWTVELDQIKDLAWVIGALKSIRSMALQISNSRSRVWGRAYLKDYMSALQNAFANGLQFQPQSAVLSGRDARPTLLSRGESMMTDNNGRDYFTPGEVAKILKMHRSSVMRRFANYPGVIDISIPTTTRRGKRPRRMIRIPYAILTRFIHEHQIR